MNKLRFYTTIYTSLNNRKGLPFWVLSPLRRIVRTLANISLPKYLSEPVKYSDKLAKGLIVSLTSFPGRIDVVWQVVETLKRQSLCPDKIILWLSKKQFPTNDTIPPNLWGLQDDIFEIRLVEDDIRSHKKYYYVMQEYQDNTIITCDDDIYYHPDMIKNLILASRNNPNSITANVTSQLKYSEKELCPYKEWENNYKAFCSFNRVQIGVGGVLYPPNVLDKRVFRKDLFMRLAPYADDLWLNSMARLAKTPVVQTAFHYLPMEIHTVSPSLSSVNNGKDNLNDKQLIEIRQNLVESGSVDVYSYDYKVD